MFGQKKFSTLAGREILTIESNLISGLFMRKLKQIRENYHCSMLEKYLIVFLDHKNVHFDTNFVPIAELEANILAVYEFPAAILKICINYANEARSHLCLWIKLFLWS